MGAIAVRSHAMPIQAANHAPAAFGFAASGVATLVAVVTETTWLAAGTFVVTAGGVLKMLYQMRIDSLRDQTRIDLLRAKDRLETLEARASESEKKAAAAEKLAADAHTAAEVLRSKYEAAQDQLLRLDANQQLIRRRAHDTANRVNAIGLEIAAAKSATPDPDKPLPVVVVNDPAHPANVTLPRGEAPGA